MTSKKTKTFTYSQFENDENLAPVLNIWINNCYKEDSSTTEKFIIDTGSDITIVKKEIIDLLELIIVTGSEIVLEGIGTSDTPVTVELCFLDIEIPELNITERIEAAIDKDNEINLLGRDFLNKICIFFEGPELRFLVYG